MFVAQDLEGGLHCLLKIIDLKLQASGKTRVQLNLDTPQSYTKLGAIFDHVQLFEYLTDAERKMTQQGMRARNFLVHGFWQRKELDYASQAGRRLLLQELRQGRDKCQKAREIVQSPIDRHLAQFGTSLDAIGEPIADVWQSDDSIQ